MPQLSNFPNSIYAGDSIDWLISSIYLPSDGFALYAHLIPDDGSGNSQISIESTEHNDNYLFQVASTVTDDYIAGKYRLIVVATSTTERITISEGLIEIKKNPLTSTSSESFNKSTLRLLQAAYANILSGGVLSSSVSVNGNSYTRTNLEELRLQINHYQALVNAENRAISGKNQFQSIQVRFR
jgi:hypothetical protein